MEKVYEMHITRKADGKLGFYGISQIYTDANSPAKYEILRLMDDAGLVLEMEIGKILAPTAGTRLTAVNKWYNAGKAGNWQDYLPVRKATTDGSVKSKRLDINFTIANKTLILKAGEIEISFTKAGLVNFNDYNFSKPKLNEIIATTVKCIKAKDTSALDAYISLEYTGKLADTEILPVTLKSNQPNEFVQKFIPIISKLNKPYSLLDRIEISPAGAGLEIKKWFA